MPPPTNGPAYQTQAFVQFRCTSSGPKARAGFIAAPVSGPPISTSIVIVSPIARPAIDLNVPPGSAAVANTTHTRKNVKTPSITTPCHTLTPLPRAGEPRFVVPRTLAE